MIFTRVLQTLKAVSLRELRVRPAFCAACQKQSLMVRLQDNEIFVRCLRCRASAVSLSLVSVLEELGVVGGAECAYELSARGPLFRYLQARCQRLECSEYFPDVEPGTMHNGVQCQDVQQLTFAAETFDLCTSTDVFEHVANDQLGFENILRVLKDGGYFVFTVPIDVNAGTVERARLLANGEIEHILEPEYHGDPVAASGRILAFRNYGADIIERLLQAGFGRAYITRPGGVTPWGYARHVIVAQRTGVASPRHPAGHERVEV